MLEEETKKATKSPDEINLSMQKSQLAYIHNDPNPTRVNPTGRIEENRKLSC